jgi:hypothetical protein
VIRFYEAQIAELNRNPDLVYDEHEKTRHLTALKQELDKVRNSAGTSFPYGEEASNKKVNNVE